jgi:ribosomal protein S18 acetylase RimI-like enzyme
MDSILSSSQVQSFTSEIRSLGQGLVTNFFWDDKKHPYWLEEGRFFFLKENNCYLLFHQNDTFTHLFYIATHQEAVATAISHILPKNDIVIDLIVRKEGDGLTEILKDNGFETYKALYRMSHIGLLAEDSWNPSLRVAYVTFSDLPLVYNALQSSFDPLCEQLPTLKEVEDFAQRKQILVVKDGDNLCGFIIFELSGSTTWYLRYWYISPDYRNQGIGSELLRNALIKGKETKRQQLWVLSDNENAIKRYEHYGFRREHLTDYVMIKRYDYERKDC